jgi:hypothetical protein
MPSAKLAPHPICFTEAGEVQLRSAASSRRPKPVAGPSAARSAGKHARLHRYQIQIVASALSGFLMIGLQVMLLADGRWVGWAILSFTIPGFVLMGTLELRTTLVCRRGLHEQATATAAIEASPGSLPLRVAQWVCNGRMTSERKTNWAVPGSLSPWHRPYLTAAIVIDAFTRTPPEM